MKPTIWETATIVGALCVIMGFLSVLAIPAFAVGLGGKVYEVWNEWRQPEADIDKRFK